MADYEQAMKAGQKPRTIDQQMWQEGFQLGREQGMREAQTIAVSFLHSYARKIEWESTPGRSAAIAKAADKLAEMKFLDASTGEAMPGFASHILQQYIRETRGDVAPKDAAEMYQLELTRYWMHHLEHVLMSHAENFIRGREMVQEILREFLYGVVPHPYDADDRERLRSIAIDSIASTTRPRYTP